MSRSIKGKKPQGDYEYWSARPGNKGGGRGIGAVYKTRTHKLERLNAKRALLKEESHVRCN